MDPALAPGRPELLPAVGALKIAMFLISADGSLIFDPLQQRPQEHRKLRIFRTAFFMVARECAKSGQHKKNKPEPAQRFHAQQACHNIQDHIQPHEEKGQLIGPMSAVHDSLQPIHKKPVFSFDQYAEPVSFIISFPTRFVKKAIVNIM